jgi:transcriptional regulator with XRE-family HTH domain
MTTKLQELREERLMTQAELAGRAGITTATISRIENGRRQPTFATIKKLALALGVAPQALVPR